MCIPCLHSNEVSEPTLHLRGGGASFFTSAPRLTLMAGDATGDAEYKAAHEAFVSGHSGCTNSEVMGVVVFAACTIVAVSLVSRSSVTDAVSSAGGDGLRRIQKHVWALMEMLATLCCLCASLLYSQYTATCSIVLCGCIFFVGWVTARRFPAFDAPTAAALSCSRPLFVSIHRVGLTLLTCFCILAVDFPAFPRRLAKTEMYGTGLMDIGAGCFVFSLGFTSRSARGMPGRMHATGQSLFLLALGTVRTVVIKAVGYQEHVTEYGTSWNFFLSLACLALANSAFHVGARYSIMAGSVMTVVYQYCLHHGLADFILHAERTTFLSANREGVVGLVGYYCIYLGGVGFGYVFLQKRRAYEWRAFCGYMGVTIVAMWVLLSALIENLQPVSRRLTNGPYVLWVVVVSVSSLYLCLVLSIVLVQRKLVLPFFLENINKHLLFVFLVVSATCGCCELC